MSKGSDNLHYFAGNDYFLEQQQRKIIDQLDDCETETFSAEDFNPEFFFNFINTPSLFQENKAAVVRSAGKLKDAVNIVSKCKECIETHLIFLSAETKLGKELNRALKDAGFKVTTEKKASRYDLSGKILQMFTDAGFKIDSSSSMELNEIFEGDLKQVENEIEKLSAYFAYKKPQSPSDIMNAVTARKQDNIFIFIDAFTQRQRRKCSTLLNSFISSGENLNILINLLFKRMKELYLFINLKDQIKENRPWMLDKIKAGERVWEKQDLINLYGLFAELDYKTKTGQISAENYLTTLVSRL